MDRRYYSVRRSTAATMKQAQELLYAVRPPAALPRVGTCTKDRIIAIVPLRGAAVAAALPSSTNILSSRVAWVLSSLRSTKCSS